MAYNIIFAGTPDIAANVLTKILGSKHNVLAVLTQKDRPKGRGQKLTQSLVKAEALAHDIPVLQPGSLKKVDIQDTLRQYQPDLLIVVAYGMILPANVLSIPKYGCLNVHYSLLPRWRGAAPIQRAIEKGDAKTGVSVMQMDEGLDTGDVLHTISCDINADDTSASLYAKLAILGPEALLATLDDLDNKSLSPSVQNNKDATYAHKLTKQEALIDWQNSAAVILRQINAFNPWPVAQTSLDAKVIRIWQASLAENHVKEVSPGEIISAIKGELIVATGDGALRLSKLQLPGKSVAKVSDLLNAYSAFFHQGALFF